MAVGYQPNGFGRLAPRGIARETQRFRMTVEQWRADRRGFFDGCRDEIAVLLGERDWRLTDDEPMACLWFALADEPE